MKKINKILNNFIFAGTAIAAAQNIPLKAPAGFERLEDITLPNVVSTIVKTILVIAALIAFFYLVMGGIKWITSGGDKEKTAAAQSTLTAALVGLVIVFAAWAIIRLIQEFFGIEILGKISIPQIP